MTSCFTGTVHIVQFYSVYHCVKSVHIRRFFWSVYSRIQSECGKIRTRKNSVYGHFTQCMPIIDVFNVLSFRSFANSFFDLFPFTPHVMGLPRNYFFILIYCDQAKLRQYPLFCKVHPENQKKVSTLATM